jgi:hypothetical protein
VLIQVDFTYVVSLFLGIAGAFWGLARMLLAQSQKHIDEKFKGIAETLRGQDDAWRRIERDVMDLRAELPRDYVRREDHNRVIGAIHVSIDNLRLTIERHLLERRHGGGGGHAP